MISRIAGRRNLIQAAFDDVEQRHNLLGHWRSLLYATLCCTGRCFDILGMQRVRVCHAVKSFEHSAENNRRVCFPGTI
jgi:hypothetical protein